MTYFITQDQFAALEQLFLDDTNPTRFADIYDQIVAYLQGPDLFGTDSPGATFAWFNAAAQTNRGEGGGASDFIRDYTAAQLEIRLGASITDMDGLLQRASNAIAQAVYEDIEGLKQTTTEDMILADGTILPAGSILYAIPTAIEIGERDAIETVTVLEGETSVQNGIGTWSGNPLYIGLGSDVFWEQNVLDGDPTGYDLAVALQSFLSASGSVFNAESLLDLGRLFASQGGDLIDVVSSSQSAIESTADTIGRLYGSQGPSWLPNFIEIADFALASFNVGSQSADVLSPIFGSLFDGYIHGGAGDDVVRGFSDGASQVDYAGLFDGGEGYDVATFVGSTTYDGSQLHARLINHQSDRPFSSHVEMPFGGDAALFDFEVLRLTDTDDRISVEVLDASSTSLSVIDGEGESDFGDTIDLSKLRTIGVAVDLASGTLTANGMSLEVLDFENVIGTVSDDTIRGSDDDNVIDGGAGDDLLEGRSGDDTLYDGDGNNRLLGGADDDTIHLTINVAQQGGPSGPALEGGGGPGGLLLGEGPGPGGGSGFEVVGTTFADGGAGIDTLDVDGFGGGVGLGGGTLQWTAFADAGTGELTFEVVDLVSSQSAITDTARGFETVSGVGTVSLTRSAAGIDHGGGRTVAGVEYTDLTTIWGSSFADTITADADVTWISGGEGDDVLRSVAESARVDGGAGDDTISILDGRADGGDDDDVMTTTAGSLNGGRGDDTLTATVGGSLDGGAGADVLYASAGGAVYGDASDTLYFGDMLITGNGNLIPGGGFRDVLLHDPFEGKDWVITLTALRPQVVEAGTQADVTFGAHLFLDPGFHIFDEDNNLQVGLADLFFPSFRLGDFGIGTNGVPYSIGYGSVITRLGDGTYEELFVRSLPVGDIGVGSTEETFASGTLEDDALIDDDGARRLVGLSGDDTLSGAGGDDTIEGGTGDDSIDGGAGNDLLTGDGPMISTDGRDVFVISAGEDTITDFDLRRDLLWLGGGDFDFGTGAEGVIVSEVDDDLHIQHAEGLLVLEGISLAEWNEAALRGSPTGGDDDLTGTGDPDLIDGLGGDDTISGGAGDDTLVGGSGRDTLGGGDGADDLRGGDDNDGLFAGAGDDTLDGGSGNDLLYGEAGDDLIDGGSGTDSLWGFGGADVFVLSAGDDVVNDFDIEEDQLKIGGVEFGRGDTAEGVAFADGPGGLVLAHAGGSLLLKGISLDDWGLPAPSTGTAAADTLFGTSGDDTLEGLGGDDRLDGASGGSDLIDGGTGGDTVVFALSLDELDLSLVDGNLVVSNPDDGSSARLVSVEAIEADGITSTVRLDDGDRNWDAIVTTVDTDGQEVRTSLYQDGRVRVAEYGDDKIIDRAAISHSDGVLTGVLYEDGVRVAQVSFDGPPGAESGGEPDGARPWIRSASNYDIDGQTLTGREILYDDGRSATTAYDAGVRTQLTVLDLADAFDWSEIVMSYAPDGTTLTAQTRTFDDGRVRVSEFGDDGIIDGRVTTHADGKVVMDVYDAGVRTSQLSEDLGDAFAWTTREVLFEVDGATRLSRTTTYDDGRVAVTSYEDGVATGTEWLMI